MLPSRVGVRMHFSNGFSFFWLRAESAPKPLVSKKPMEFDAFQSWFRRPRDRSSARSVSKTCSKKRLPEEKQIYFLHFFCFWPPRAADQKTAAKMASEVLPERLQTGAQNRSTSRLRPARGARQVIFEISGGLPGSRGGHRRAKEPSGPPREAQGRLLRPFWLHFGASGRPFWSRFAAFS